METIQEPVVNDLTSAEKRKLRKKNYKQKKRKENRQSGSLSSSSTDPNLFSQETDQNEQEKNVDNNVNRGILRGTSSVLRQLKSEPLISEIGLEDDKPQSKVPTIVSSDQKNDVNNINTNNKIEDHSGEEKSTSEATDQPKNPKKRTYGPWLGGEDGPSSKKQKPYHFGLRCKKCFALLARDQDFERKNGQLWIDPELLRGGWDGLIMKGDRVYCKNMHAVGHKRFTTWTNLTRHVAVLKPEKTTYNENFVNNPMFVNHDVTKNKLNYAQTIAGDIVNSLPNSKELISVEPIVNDRYNPDANKNVVGVNNWIPKETLVSEQKS